MRRTRYEFKNGVHQPVLTEENVLREIVWRLWLQAKIKVWRIRERIPGRGALSTAGIPDLIGWIPLTGIAVFIEVKRPGGVHRAAQTQFIDEARRGGCIAFFAESWDDVVRELGAVGIKLQS